MDEEAIGDLIRRLREERGESQQRFAEALIAVSGRDTVTGHEVGRWEGHGRVPGPYWRTQLSRLTGIPHQMFDRAAAVAKRHRGDTNSPMTAFHGHFPRARLTPGIIGSELILPAGSALPGTSIAVHYIRDLTPDCLQTPRRSLILDQRQGRLLALDARYVGRRPVPPAAYSLDELTLGVLWAVANLDDSLLADDAVLSESRQQLSAYERLPTSAVSTDAAAELSPVTRMWLGSDFCAKHILRNAPALNAVPVFWTREQRGEEACTWLLFRHKLDYLHRTVNMFGRPTHRHFCIPEDTVLESPVAERILLLLAVALMESLGIHVDVGTDPSYTTIEGFVLAPRQQAIIANWIRGAGIWHVETTVRRSLITEFTEVTEDTRAHSLLTGCSPERRLQELADYLGLDWTWLCRRSAEISAVGWEGLARPRSRLLSVDGLDLACDYLAGLAPRG